MIEYQYTSQDLNPGFREQRLAHDVSVDTELLVSVKSKWKIKLGSNSLTNK